MDEARALAGSGAASGTVIAAGSQEAGRGRAGRPWRSGGGNLFFTVFLRCAGYAAVPRALTLRTGLAVSLGIEDFAPGLSGAVNVKWPNDIMLLGPEGRGRKAAGILTELKAPAGAAAGAAGRDAVVFIGIGVNVAERDFPPELRRRATSLALECGQTGPVPELLEKILLHLHREFAGEKAPADWRERLDARLYMRGRWVRFIDGAADSGRLVEGILEGIGNDGELLISRDGITGSFVTGELDVYGF
jgi:BirA family biotin operon repressor/biotin-[acetyl-CoA-carboxylase] ligase